MKTTKTALLLAGALAVLTPAASLAQTPQAPTEAGRARLQMDPAQRAERRAERLRATLQLRQDQEPALRAYLQGSQRPAGAREARRGQRQALAQMTTPQRLDAMQARLAERQAAFQRRAEATRRFYAQLSPAQQKAFDALGPMGGRKGPGGGHHRGGPRGGTPG